MLDKYHTLLRLFIPLAAGLSLASAASAQGRLDSLQHVEEVVVTGHIVRREIIPVQALAGEQLHKLASHNVADALRYFSGVQIKDYGGVGGLKTVNIRSMGTNHVGVFYDGIELGNAQNGTVDLGRFSLDNMESITLYNGQKSAVFQPAKDFGSSGSIYLQTRTPRFDEGETHHVRATFKTGSFGVANPALLWEQRLSERVSSSLSAEYLHSSGRYKFTYRMQEGYDTTAVRRNGDINALRVEGGLFGHVEQGYWRAKVYFYNSERGYPGAIVRNKFSHEDRQWDTNFFTQGAFKKDFSSWYSLMVNGKYAYDYLHYLADPNKDESMMYTNNHYYQQELYLSAANRFKPFSWWELNLSVDYQFNLLNADLRDFVFPRRHTMLAAAASAMRFDRVEIQASLLGTWVHDRTRGNTMSDKRKLTPAVFLSWRPFGGETGLNLRAFYKRIFRMPTLNDLYYTFVGNVNLDPEFTTQYDVGATYTRTFRHTWLRSLELQADVYYNQVENKIVATPTSNFFRWTMVNLGNVEIRGVDAAVQTGWDFGRDLSLTARLNYTYQRAQDFTDRTSEFYGGQIPYIPWHSGSAVLNAAWKRWELSYSFIYTGERYSSQANIPYNYQLPWYTSDLSLARSWSVRKGELKATLEVNNLLNQQYEVVACYPMPGTNFKVILQYGF